MNDEPDGSVYDAIYLAVADQQDVSFGEVKAVMLHRDVPGDSFWFAWDQAVSDATQVFCQVTGRTPKEEQ